MEKAEDFEVLKKAVDCVCSFLSRRDISELSQSGLTQRIGRPQVDALFVFGCDLTEVPECAVQAFHQGLCKVLLFSGGIGHGTEGLRKNAAKKYGFDCAGLSEAEIMAEIAVHFLDVPADKVFTEMFSTNSGENARFSLKLLGENGVRPKSILLMQDPLMQLRSHLSLQKFIDPLCDLLSYAPFVPQTDKNRPWPNQRFYELILREIPRIYDDENGYGPNGLNYIMHCDVPPEVMQSYRFILRNIEKEDYTA